MARIAGVNIPDNKHTRIALTGIYGVGVSRAELICSSCALDPSNKIKDLTEAELEKLRQEVNKYLVEGDLRREVATNIKRKQDIGSYQGRRHRAGLPVRGQQTKTNARTRKGRPKLVRKKKKEG